MKGATAGERTAPAASFESTALPFFLFTSSSPCFSCTSHPAHHSRDDLPGPAWLPPVLGDICLERPDRHSSRPSSLSPRRRPSARTSDLLCFSPRRARSHLLVVRSCLLHAVPELTPAPRRPLYRCLQTATPTAERLGLPIHVEHGVSEWYLPVKRGLHPVRPPSLPSAPPNPPLAPAFPPRLAPHRMVPSHLPDPSLPSLPDPTR